jgi:hypothetical protein
MTTEQKQCPECGYVFQGNGWDGIDAHWRGKNGHEDVMPYRAAWGLIRTDQYVNGAEIHPGSIVEFLIRMERNKK